MWMQKIYISFIFFLIYTWRNMLKEAHVEHEKKRQWEPQLRSNSIVLGFIGHQNLLENSIVDLDCKGQSQIVWYVHFYKLSQNSILKLRSDWSV